MDLIPVACLLEGSFYLLNTCLSPISCANSWRVLVQLRCTGFTIFAWLRGRVTRRSWVSSIYKSTFKFLNRTQFWHYCVAVKHEFGLRQPQSQKVVLAKLRQAEQV